MKYKKLHVENNHDLAFQRRQHRSRELFFGWHQNSGIMNLGSGVSTLGDLVEYHLILGVIRARRRISVILIP